MATKHEEFSKLFAYIEIICSRYGITVDTSNGPRSYYFNINFTYDSIKFPMFIKYSKIENKPYIMFDKQEYTMVADRKSIFLLCNTIISFTTLYRMSKNATFDISNKNQFILIRNDDNKLTYKIMIKKSFTFALCDYNTLTTYDNISYADIIKIIKPKERY